MIEFKAGLPSLQVPMHFSPRKAGTGKALGAVILGAIWHKLWEFFKWFCEWVADKAFGDAAYKWLGDMVSPSAFPWLDKAADWGVTAGLVFLGLFLFWRSNKNIEHPYIEHIRSIEADNFKSNVWVYVAFFAIAIVSAIIWRFEYIRNERIAATIKDDADKKYIIALNCSFATLPRMPPSEGYINTLRVGSSEVEVLGLSERAAMPDFREWNWAGIVDSYRCEVSNASKTAITNLSMAIKLHFTKWAKYDPKSGSSGKAFELDRVRLIRIPLIMPGYQFYFYIYNMESESVNIDMPETATIYHVDNSWNNVKLISAQSMSFSLPPFNQKDYIDSIDAASKRR